MRNNRKWIVFLGMAWLSLLVALACKQEFAETPFGTTVECGSGVTFTALQGTGIITATVLGPTNFGPVNGAAVEVSHVFGTLSDPVTGAVLPDRFITQTNDQGNVTIDLTCPSDPINCGSSGAACSLFFDIGHTSSGPCTVTINLPTGTNFPDCPTDGST